MFSFFGQVIDFFKMIINLIVMVVEGLFTLLKLIPVGLSFLISAISHLPPLVSAFALAAVMVSITFLLLGRQGKA